MALPRHARDGFTPKEIEFIAEEELVHIVPTFGMDRVRLLTGVYGPFRPPAKARVPLWMAANLKQKKRCNIVPPDWLSVESLKAFKDAETSQHTFSDLPYHYIPVARILLDVAADDIPSSNEVRTLLKDLREARQSKSKQGIESLNPYHLQMNNISSLEINELRPFFVRSFHHLRKLQLPSADDLDGAAGTGTGTGRRAGGGADDDDDDVPDDSLGWSSFGTGAAPAPAPAPAIETWTGAGGDQDAAMHAF